MCLIICTFNERGYEVLSVCTSELTAFFSLTKKRDHSIIFSYLFILRPFGLSIVRVLFLPFCSQV